MPVATKSEVVRKPTVAWVDAMCERYEASHGVVGLVQYRQRLLRKHGLPVTKRDPAERTGRSQAGNLRNFSAMTWTKFVGVFVAVQLEGNDVEAMRSVELEWARRTA